MGLELVGAGVDVLVSPVYTRYSGWTAAQSPDLFALQKVRVFVHSRMMCESGAIACLLVAVVLLLLWDPLGVYE